MRLSKTVYVLATAGDPHAQLLLRTQPTGTHNAVFYDSVLGLYSSWTLNSHHARMCGLWAIHYEAYTAGGQ